MADRRRAVSTATASLDPDVVGLVERARAGDQQAFAQVYDTYVKVVHAYIRRRVQHKEVAEDLTSDVFLRAYRRLDRFEWQGVDFGAWLMTIARNRVNDHFKSAKFRLEQTTDEVRETPAEERADDPERRAVARDMARALGAALEQLKDEHREVIELRFVHDLPVAETAAVLGRSVGATKALQYRALRALAALVHDTPGLDQFVAGSMTMLIWLLRMIPS